MKHLSWVLLALLIAIQYPLWLGKGGWLRVWELNRQVDAQMLANRELSVRNAGLDAEARDLKQGLEAVEEHARADLGMVRQDEVFYQIIDKAKPASQSRPQ